MTREMAIISLWWLIVTHLFDKVNFPENFSTLFYTRLELTTFLNLVYFLQLYQTML